MPIEPRDPAYLWDMLQAAKSIRTFTANTTWEQYSSNEMMQLAVERQLTVMGEAARRLSDTFKKTHPEIPWRQIIAQRNFLMHEYSEILDERVWEVVTVHIPALILLLEPLVPPLPPQSV